MAGFSIQEVQAGLVTLLKADATLIALLADGASSIRDFVPGDSNLPYVSLGDVITEAEDTMTINGLRINFDIHTWTGDDSRGKKAAQDIMSAIYDVLHRTNSLTATGYNVVLVQMTSAFITLDADGVTQHGVQRFTIITDAP